MFEHITGGYVLAGYHEVVYTEATQSAVDKVLNEIESGKDRILWRVSSTLFSHLRSDVDISPLEDLAHLYSEEDIKMYKKMTAYEKLMEELRATNMVKDGGEELEDEKVDMV
jgi:hypothetical protein